MQTEDKRACAACGAANRTDANSCWQCFSVPPGASHATGAGGDPHGAPASFAADRPATGRDRGRGGTARSGASWSGWSRLPGLHGVQRVLGGGGVELPDTSRACGIRRRRVAFEAEMTAGPAATAWTPRARVYGTGARLRSCSSW